ncbi:unnamed protein product [Effrenium voratum]|nr:unnamed protein product [Effrenium voratum]
MARSRNSFERIFARDDKPQPTEGQASLHELFSMAMREQLPLPQLAEALEALHGIRLTPSAARLLSSVDAGSGRLSFSQFQRALQEDSGDPGAGAGRPNVFTDQAKSIIADNAGAPKPPAPRGDHCRAHTDISEEDFVKAGQMASKVQAQGPFRGNVVVPTNEVSRGNPLVRQDFPGEAEGSRDMTRTATRMFISGELDRAGYEKFLTQMGVRLTADCELQRLILSHERVPLWLAKLSTQRLRGTKEKRAPCVARWLADRAESGAELRERWGSNLDSDLELACRDAAEQIWSEASLKVLLMLVGNVLEHPGETKYHGPIRKSNQRIAAHVLPVPGAVKALQLAGFQEDTEGFFLPWVRPGALRQVHAALRRQEATLAAGAAKAKPRPALASSKPKFDENLLREIQAEAQYQAQLRTPGAPSAPKPAPAAARSTGDLRLRLRVQLMGSLELKVPSTTRVADFQGQIKQLTGVPSHHQRVRFGFPSRVLEGNDASLADVGLQDGELLILEDLHDLFLGNLESGQFTMEEMLGKLPPVSEEESTESLFFDVLSAFQIGMLEMDFWRTMRRKLREALAGKEEEMEKLAVGLYKLQRLFRHHDSRQRLHLILSSLPRSRHANKMNVKRSSFLFSVACQVGDMERGAMLSRLCISYDGEKGVDAGGLTRDFFTSFGLHLAEEPNLFQPTGRGGLHPTRRSRPKQPTDLRTPSHLMYKVCGRVFAMAILHGCKVGRRLSRPFVRNLLGAASSLTLQELQEELNFEAGEERDFRGSREFLEKPLKELGLEGVLTFQNQGEELEPGGAQREVTDENKEDWLMKTLRWELFGAANYAAGWFRAGLIDVLGGHKTICPLLCLFDAGDLMELWGTGGIARQELKQWKAVTSLNPSIQQQGAWFWQVLEEDFDDELRGKVLQFATGSSSIGRQGLVDFRLEPGDGGDGRLPTAMTCGRPSSPPAPLKCSELAVERQWSFQV